jgi:hypothetical protein
MLFGSVVGGLGECAALRHLLPEDQLWRRAATGLVAVINAGLPAGRVQGEWGIQPAWAAENSVVKKGRWH